MTASKGGETERSAESGEAGARRAGETTDSQTATRDAADGADRAKPPRAALFPVAGSDLKWFARNAAPRELLPVLDRPLIQYAVEEALGAGCDRLVFVTRPDNDALRRFVETCAAVGDAETHFVAQDDGRGLGRAVLSARALLEAEDAFAVILPDDLIDAAPSATAQLIARRTRFGGALVAGIEVPRVQIARYGIMRIEDTGGDVVRVAGLVEKPDGDASLSNFAIVGRYVLPREIFEALARTAPDANGALQLTDAIAALIPTTPVWGARFQGERFDCGDLAGFVRATIAHAVRRDDVRGPTVTYMRRTLDRLERGGGVERARGRDGRREHWSGER